jgi:protein-tyrosine phosphatase
VTTALGVAPSECVYVGEGGSDELNGARALGMTTVRIDQRGAFARNGCPAPADYVVVRLDELLELPLFADERSAPPLLDVAWIRPDLAIGGRIAPANVPRLRVLGIDSVVDLRAEEADDPELLAEHELRFLHLPMTDTDPLTQKQLREGSRWIAAERAAGRTVLVHCQHGVGRSVMLVAAVLLGEGSSVTGALDHVRARRPRMALSSTQLLALHDYGAAFVPAPGS